MRDPWRILWLLAAIGLAVVAEHALAAPPAGSDPNSPMAAWYRSLKTPNGGSCCSEADCRPVDARQTASGWEISNGLGKWDPVPPDRVLRRDNEDGRPIVCIFGGRILCFVPPSMT